MAMGPASSSRRAGPGVWAVVSGLLVGLVPTHAGGVPAEASRVEIAACGGPGQPACPLQSFMRSRLAAPLARGAVAEVAAGFEQLAFLTPDPAWSDWRGYALAGASAAKVSDLGAVRHACNGCHTKYRDAYRAKYRLRPAPR